MAIARKAKATKVVLSETTAIVAANIGDNSGISGHVLPMPEDTHREIEATLIAIATSEAAIDYARQKLAHLLSDRHEQLVATKPAGTIPFAHDLAINATTFASYLDALVTEFTLADAETLKAQSAQEQQKHRNKLGARLARALRLFANLSWFKANNPSAICQWDYDISRWRVAPQAFVTAGYSAGGDLLKLKDQTTDVLSVVMEHDDAKSYYFIMKQRSAPTVINLSLEQFNYAIASQIKAGANPTVDTSTNEPTAARATRAARQAGTTAAKDAPDVATEDSDTPEATAPSAQGDRAFYVGQLLKLLVAVEKLLEHDELQDMSWSDMTKGATNGITAITMMVDRMNKRAGDKSTDKPAARKQAA
jgi:hypothetical protein